MFSYVGAYLCELNTNPANKFAHVMRLTYSRWCACPTDYLNKLEYLCVCWIKINWEKKTINTKCLKCSIYIKKKTSHQGNLKQRLGQVLGDF